MTPERIRDLLSAVSRGEMSVAEAERHLAWQPLEDIGVATIDHHRALRQGFPEVIYGEGKTVDQVCAIAERLAGRGDGFLATRVPTTAAARLGEMFAGLEWNELARTAFLPPSMPLRRDTRGPVLVIAAGTSDLPVAEEAAVTARAMGNPVERLTDVGVAGLHRLLAASDTLRRASVVIAVAGMEGALPSVIGGLIAAPVIAVPTSVGYGVAQNGMTALFAMLTSCASGITVVNIDNGFGAACAATRANMVLNP